ncbi:MAG: hypothetical protein Q9208_004691 [Pyrenodesmia sp. 3 TL-2023]
MASNPDDFRWFGEGFNGFPKTLPDDCVHYAIYIIDAKANDFTIREQLRKVQVAANALCKNLLKDFIWQRDGFGLDIVQRNGRSLLQGQTNFGDSVEDEWLIVYLLRELSRQFPKCWIRIFDSDGEFLLIEAADAIPKWLNPENAEHRVWINQGKLFIVPKARSNEKARVEALRLDDALIFIQDRASDLLHSPSIEAEAFYRLRKYPDQIRASLHHAIVMIPRRLAYVLHHDAAYVSPAVEAFYLRDPIALRPMQSKDSSKLYFPPEDLVAVSVKFTKVGYAQLKGQTFQTPPVWAACTTRGPEIPDEANSETGMKVTCGFEMLLSDPQNVDKKPVREIKLLLEDLEVGEEQLPSNDDISRWGLTRDDESWLDINFEDFDRELSGRGDHQSPGRTAGFGDKMAQENLRKIVARFENLLHEEDGSAEDAEFLDDMDNDDESEDSGTTDGTASDDSTSGSGEKGVDFDEDRFDSMMREMMGLPPSAVVANAADMGLRPGSQAVSGEEDAGMHEEKGIRQVMKDMEAELRQAGALSLEPPSTG